MVGRVYVYKVQIICKLYYKRTYAPSPAGVLGCSTKGDAGRCHALGANAGAAAHQLVDGDGHLPIVSAPPITPAPNETHVSN